MKRLLILLLFAMPAFAGERDYTLYPPRVPERIIVEAIPPDPLPQTRTFPALDANNAFTGNNTHGGTETFTGLMSQTNPGLFDNSAYRQISTQSVNGCNNQNLYSNLNGGNEMAAFNACILVPSTATQRQDDAIAGMVDQQSGANSPAVGVFGGALGDSVGARAWGANFVAIEVAGKPTGAMEGVEIDYNVNNATSIPNGLSVTGAWSAQPASGTAVEISQNNAGFSWPSGLAFFVTGAGTKVADKGIDFGFGSITTFGINFQQGSTPQSDTAHAAIRLSPVAAGVSQESQGITFFGTTGGGGPVMEKLRVLPSGALDVNATGGGGTFSVGGGTPLSTTNQTGTGSLVLATSPTIATPTISGPPVAAGTAAGLTGTGACATITTQKGGAWAGQATCTGTTGASTFIITAGTTAPNGWSCTASDLTTAANILRQSTVSATACTIAGTVNANDVLTFTAVAY
jgi:hypothetical protein